MTMRSLPLESISYDHPGAKTYFPVGVLLMVGAVVAAVVLTMASGLDRVEYPYLFLLPWIAGLTGIFGLPLVLLVYKRNFSVDNPIVFSTLTYFLPVFIGGGICLATGVSSPYYLQYIEDPVTELPYAVFLVAIGYLGLCAGYFLFGADQIGSRLGRKLPTLSFPINNYLGPAASLLVLGVINSLIAFTLGLLGYQKADVIQPYDGLIYLTTLFWVEGSFIVWFICFKQTKWTAPTVLVLLFQIASGLFTILISGSKGATFHLLTLIMLAFVLSGRKLTFRRVGTVMPIVCVMVLLGIMYGATFRSIKGSEAMEDTDTYIGNVGEALTQMSQTGDSMLWSGVTSLADRLDSLGCLAVVVSTHEKLEPYEVSYELDNNILKDSATFFIPRVLWPDKPLASDPRRYSDLYFNYGDNSFAITSFGDLLRNFGAVGVPIGMMLIGFILRIIYSSLVEGQARELWRATMYFMLLTAFNYETFYGAIIPYLFKNGTTALVGIAFVVLGTFLWSNYSGAKRRSA